MEQITFLGALAAFLTGAIGWGFKYLPAEKWQIMAVIPKQKGIQGRWKGLNLTYYGVLCANAAAFAVFIFIILSASVRMPVIGLALLILLLLAICLPAATIMARIVEKKTGTLTVGGAVFTGTILAPVLVYAVNRIFDFNMSITVFLAAVSVAYAFGEGLGRLACISFGCCYGKPLKDCSPWVQTVFKHFHLTFKGRTKKIAYASELQGEKVIPIQIITAALYSVSGLWGTWLFLNGFFITALLGTLMITQIWRFLSEFFRADFRGKLTITPYQVMSIVTILYASAIGFFFNQDLPLPVLQAGFETLWTPGMILMVQVVWAATFLYTGRSVVTGATIRLHVVKERI